MQEENGYGLCDMSGVVDEWVWDRDGVYPDSKQINHTGGEHNTIRVVRGDLLAAMPGVSVYLIGSVISQQTGSSSLACVFPEPSPSRLFSFGMVRGQDQAHFFQDNWNIRL